MVSASARRHSRGVIVDRRYWMFPAAALARFTSSTVSMDTGTPDAAAMASRSHFIWSMVRLQPKLFAIAVSGAAVFALLTVASSFAISWVIDNVVVPRFEDGEVATDTVVAGLSLVLGIGVVRAVAIVVRRTFASITQWRVAEHYIERVLDRLLS